MTRRSLNSSSPNIRVTREVCTCPLPSTRVTCEKSVQSSLIVHTSHWLGPVRIIHKTQFHLYPTYSTHIYPTYSTHIYPTYSTHILASSVLWPHRFSCITYDKCSCPKCSLLSLIKQLLREHSTDLLESKS